MKMFQPFLRFWHCATPRLEQAQDVVSTLLEILGGAFDLESSRFFMFQPFLRFWGSVAG